MAFMSEHGLEYTFVDFKKEQVGCEVVEKWLTLSDIKTLLNTKGTTYKTLKLKELGLGENGQKEWICKQNMLIKRPVIEFNDRLVVGFDLEHYQRIFL
jgi:Spx/MgsR family transcriptional regulator